MATETRAASTTRERTFEFTLTRDADTTGDGLTFGGYAAVFNSPTSIRDSAGEYTEVIAPGAFKRTIASHMPVLMFDHGKHPLLGPMPLGKITQLREDARGLFIEARLSDNWLVQPVRDAIADGAINGMSFRFEAIKESWAGQGKTTTRTLREVKVPELGPVVFPAYSDTTASVRSAFTALEGQLGVKVEFTDTRDDELSTQDSSVADLVSDAIESMWGLSDNSSDAYIVNFYDGVADFVVYGTGMSDYPGLWRVNYTYTDGTVTLGPVGRAPLADPVTGLNTPQTEGAMAANSQDPDGEIRDEPQDHGTPEEPALEGTSEGPADEPTVHTGPFSLDERRRIARQIRAVQRAS